MAITASDFNQVIVTDAISNAFRSCQVDFSLFATNYSEQAINPGDTVKVPLIAATGGMLSGSNKLSDGTGNSSFAALTAEEAFISIPFAPEVINNGLNLKNMVHTLTMSFIYGIQQKLWTKVKAAVAAGTVSALNIGTAANFTPAAITKTIRPPFVTSGAGQPALLLTPEYYGGIIPTNREGLDPWQPAYGCRAVREITGLDGDTAAVGMAASVDGIGLVSRVPKSFTSVTSYETVMPVNIPEIGFSGCFVVYRDGNTREAFAALASCIALEVVKPSCVRMLTNTANYTGS